MGNIYKEVISFSLDLFYEMCTQNILVVYEIPGLFFEYPAEGEWQYHQHSLHKKMKFFIKDFFSKNLQEKNYLIIRKNISSYYAG